MGGGCAGDVFGRRVGSLTGGGARNVAVGTERSCGDMTDPTATVMYGGKTITFQEFVGDFDLFLELVAFSRDKQGLLGRYRSPLHFLCLSFALIQEFSAVIDLFSTVWGPCKAMGTTFRTLFVNHSCLERPVKFLRVSRTCSVGGIEW